MLAAQNKDAPVAFVQAVVRWLYSDEPLDEMAQLASYPIAVQSPGNGLTLMGVEQLIEAMSLFRKAATAMRIARVESEVVSLSNTDAGLVVVTLENQRLTQDGQSLGAHRSTYVILWEEPYWRIRSLSVGDHEGFANVISGIETIFQREFGAAELVGADPGDGPSNGRNL